MKNRAVVALILVSAFFALFGWISRTLAEHFAVFQQIALRSVVASVLLYALYARTIRTIPLSWYDHGIAALRGFLLGPVSTALFVVALQKTSVSNVYFLIALPFSVIEGPLLFREKWSVRNSCAALVAIVGAALISSPDLSNGLFSGEGELLAIASAITGGLGIAVRKWHSPSAAEISIAFYGVVYSALMCLAISLVIEDWPGSWNPVSISVTLGAGVLVAACSRLLAYGYRRLDVSTAGIVMLLESVFGCAVAVGVYGEVLTPQVLAGAGAIILSSVVAIVSFPPLQTLVPWANRKPVQKLSSVAEAST